MATAENGFRTRERIALEEEGRDTRIVFFVSSNDAGLMYEDRNNLGSYCFVPWHRIRWVIATRED